MVCKYFIPLLATVAAFLISSVVSDTKGFYQPPSNNLNQAAVQNPLRNDFFGNVSPNTAVVASPRSYRVWNPLDYLSLDCLVQPAITGIGLIVATYTFAQITSWLLEVIEATTSKSGEKEKDAKKKTDGDNEIESNRRRRMISDEDTAKIITTIEKAEKQFGQ